MEVHKHPHHITHKKNWGEYFLEFFMLFLAVFLGFVAENIRETSVENAREKEYINSIAEDLQQDINQLDSIVLKRTVKNMMMDSILYLLNSDPNQHGNDVYYYARWLPRTYRFYSNDRTFLQLNAGSWRLIHNNKVSDALLAYNGMVRTITVYIEQREESLVLLMYPSLDKLFDNRVFQKMLNGLSFDRPDGNPQLLSTDKTEINKFCNEIHFAQNANYYFLAQSKTLVTHARKSLDILKSEYHLSE
ncbi:MAG: hypothetical protein ABJA57_07520 [Ginsengibacter sp.]